MGFSQSWSPWINGEFLGSWMNIGPKVGPTEIDVPQTSGDGSFRAESSLSITHPAGATLALPRAPGPRRCTRRSSPARRPRRSRPERARDPTAAPPRLARRSPRRVPSPRLPRPRLALDRDPLLGSAPGDPPRTRLRRRARSLLRRACSRRRRGHRRDHRHDQHRQGTRARARLSRGNQRNEPIESIPRVESRPDR